MPIKSYKYLYIPLNTYVYTTMFASWGLKFPTFPSAPTITGQVGSTLMPVATVAPAPAEVLQGGNGKFNHRDRMWHW